MTNEELIKYAMKAQKKSYSPYSNFRVGAALLTKKGKVYLGTNIENCDFPAGICAERCAFCAAIAKGDREFEKIAIIGDSEELCYPCGLCRQVIVELAPDIAVVCASSETDYKEYFIKNLLPKAFVPENLGEES